MQNKKLMPKFVLKIILPVLSFPRHIGTPSPSARTWASASCSAIKFIMFNFFIFIHKGNWVFSLFAFPAASPSVRPIPAGSPPPARQRTRAAKFKHKVNQIPLMCGKLCLLPAWRCIAVGARTFWPRESAGIGRRAAPCWAPRCQAWRWRGAVQGDGSPRLECLERAFVDICRKMLVTKGWNFEMFGVYK